MILECDIGNSRCKWRVAGAENMSGGFDYREQGFEALKQLSNIDAVYACAVVSEEVCQKFVKACRDFFACSPILATATAECAGVRNAYSEPAKLGVDRWSALVAAFKQRQGAVLVVDAGSALTVDLVDRQGSHQGGYIVPGYRMMQESLLSETAGVRFEATGSSSGFGKNTQQAVNAGITTALLAVIKQSIAQAKNAVGENVVVVLTGGDATQFAGLLDEPVNLVPDLVLDGLQWLLAEHY